MKSSSPTSISCDGHFPRSPPLHPHVYKSTSQKIKKIQKHNNRPISQSNAHYHQTISLSLAFRVHPTSDQEASSSPASSDDASETALSYAALRATTPRSFREPTLSAGAGARLPFSDSCMHHARMSSLRTWREMRRTWPYIGKNANRASSYQTPPNLCMLAVWRAGDTAKHVQVLGSFRQSIQPRLGRNPCWSGVALVDKFCLHFSHAEKQSTARGSVFRAPDTLYDSTMKKPPMPPRQHKKGRRTPRMRM